MRTILWLAAVAVLSAGSMRAQSSRLPGCYAFTWGDSLLQGRLPDSVQLDSLSDPSDFMKLQVRPVAYMAGSGSKWQPVGEAWWLPRGDTLLLAYTRGFNGWYFALHLVRDSLSGSGRGRTSSGETPPVMVSARRISCGNGLSTVDSTFEAAFKCPDDYPTTADAARAVKGFLDWVGATHPNWTVGETILFRYALLVNHNCWSTLGRMRSHVDSTGGGA